MTGIVTISGEPSNFELVRKMPIVCVPRVKKIIGVLNYDDEIVEASDDNLLNLLTMGLDTK